MSRVAELTASLDSIPHKSTKDNNIERLGVGLSISMGATEEINQVENLDCSVVKLATSPRKPTTSRYKSLTSSSSLSILYDIVRGCGAGGGDGGSCAGAGAGAGISRATSSAA
ncbi:hypothetical protein Tco_0567722 [Tanacetum coccineum]